MSAQDYERETRRLGVSWTQRHRPATWTHPLAYQSAEWRRFCAEIVDRIDAVRRADEMAELVERRRRSA